MKIWVLLIIGILLLSGCASQTKIPVTVSGQPAKVAQTVNQYIQKKNWHEAFALLQQAQQKYPQNPELAAAEKHLQDSWKPIRNQLFHKVLLSETRALFEQQKILENLLAANPSDLKAQTKQFINATLLSGLLNGLIECGKSEEKNDVVLSIECKKYADLISNSKSLKQEYQKSLKQYRTQKKAEKTRRKKTHQARVRKKNSQALEQAEKLLAEGKYPETRNILNRVLKKTPDEPQALQLQQQLETAIADKTGMMMQMANQLYRDGKIEAAINTWKQLLLLSPAHPEAQTKLRRARYVFEKLQKLRKKQSTTPQVQE